MAGTTTSRVNIVFAGENKDAIAAADGVGNAINRLAVQAAGAFVGIKGTEFFADAVESASGLSEQTSKSIQVFGDGADAVKAFAEGAAEAIGQSEQQALEATGTFGNLFTSAGIIPSQAQEMSISLTKLASDLASFNDVDVDTALTALRSGVVGETEPLKALGVNLNEANLKQRALTLGLSDGKSTLDASAKAQAAYSLIMEQTTKAQGDFERTSGGLANQQRIASAEFENTKAVLGEALLPAVSLVTKGGTELLQLFQMLPGPVQTVATGIGVLAVGAAVLVPHLQSGLATLTGLIPGMGAAATATGSLATAETAAALAAEAELAATEHLEAMLLSQTATEAEVAGALAVKTAATAEATVANEALAKSTADAQASSTGLAGALGPLAAVAAVAGAAFIASKQTVVDFAEIARDALKATDEEALELARKVAALNELKGGNGFVEIGETDLAALKRMGDLVEEQSGKRLPDLDAAIEEVEASQAQSKKTQEEYGDSTDGATVSIEDQTAALEANKKAQDDRDKVFTDAIKQAQDTYDAQQGLVDAHQAVADAQADEDEARRAATGNSEEYRDALGSIQDAEEGVADAREGVTEALADVRDAEADVDEARKEATENIKDLTRAEQEATRARLDSLESLHDAEMENRRVLADPTSSYEDKRDAAYELSKAQEEAANKAADEQDATNDLTDAQRAGVEGSKVVVDAKQKVTEANKKVSDAEDRVREAVRKVGEAQQAAAAVITEAKAKVDEAARKTRDAIKDEAGAWGELVTLQAGAVEGAEAYLEALKKLGGDPELIRLLELVVAAAYGGFATDPRSQTAPGTTNVPQDNPGAVVDKPGKSLQGGTGTSINTTNNIILQGTPRQTGRAAAAAAGRELNRVARGVR